MLIQMFLVTLSRPRNAKKKKKNTWVLNTGIDDYSQKNNNKKQHYIQDHNTGHETVSRSTGHYRRMWGFPCFLSIFNH